MKTLPATIGVAALLLGIAAPADAGTGCINHTEYDNAKLGWTRSQLEVMIAANPDYWFQYNNATSTGYNHCGGDTQMMAGFTFRDGLLRFKEWNWRSL